MYMCHDMCMSCTCIPPCAVRLYYVVRCISRLTRSHGPLRSAERASRSPTRAPRRGAAPPWLLPPPPRHHQAALHSQPMRMSRRPPPRATSPLVVPRRPGPRMGGAHLRLVSDLCAFASSPLALRSHLDLAPFALGFLSGGHFQPLGYCAIDLHWSATPGAAFDAVIHPLAMGQPFDHLLELMKPLVDVGRSRATWRPR